MNSRTNAPIRRGETGSRTAARIAALGKLVRTLKYRRDHRDIDHGIGGVRRGELEYGVKLGASACNDLLLLTLDGLIERQTNWYGDEGFSVSERRYPDVVRRYRYGLSIHKLTALRKRLRAA